MWLSQRTNIFRGEPASFYEMDYAEGPACGDSSEYDHHAVIFNGTGSEYDTTIKKRGRASLSLDGVNDFAAAFIQDTNYNQSAFSVSCWCRPKSLAFFDIMMACGKDTTGGSDLKGWSMNFDGSGFSAITVGFDGGLESAVTLDVMSVGTWYHHGAVFDGPNKKLTKYFNGLPSQTITTTGSKLPLHDQPYTLGATFYQGIYQFFAHCYLDLAMHFNVPLTDAQMLDIYNEQL